MKCDFCEKDAKFAYDKLNLCKKHHFSMDDKTKELANAIKDFRQIENKTFEKIKKKKKRKKQNEEFIMRVGIKRDDCMTIYAEYEINEFMDMIMGQDMNVTLHPFTKIWFIGLFFRNTLENFVIRLYARTVLFIHEKIATKMAGLMIQLEEQDDINVSEIKLK